MTSGSKSTSKWGSLRHDVFDSFFAKTKKRWTLEDEMSPLNHIIHIMIYDVLLISSKIEFVIILYLYMCII